MMTWWHIVTTVKFRMFLAWLAFVDVRYTVPAFLPRVMPHMRWINRYVCILLISMDYQVTLWVISLSLDAAYPYAGSRSIFYWHYLLLQLFAAGHKTINCLLFTRILYDNLMLCDMPSMSRYLYSRLCYVVMSDRSIDFVCLILITT